MSKNSKTDVNYSSRVILITVVAILAIVIAMLFVKKDEVSVTFTEYNGENTVMVLKNNKIEKPADPVRDGYKFLGWYLNGELFDFNSEVTGDITLVAHWEKITKDNTHIVKFVNGDSVVTRSVLDGATVSKIVDPEKEGQEFDGWYLNGEKFDFTTKITEDITLEAHFTEKEEAKEEKNESSSYYTPSNNNYNYQPNQSNNNSSQSSSNNNSGNSGNQGSSGSSEGSGNSGTSGDSGNTEPTPTADTTAPNAFTPTFGLTSHSITVYASTTDNVTAPENLVYSYAIGSTWQDSNIFDGLEPSTQYTIKVKVTDEAGNSKTVSKNVTTDGVPVPEVESMTPTTLSNRNVFIVIKETEYTVTYSLDGTNWQAYNDSVEVTSNGTVYFKNTDSYNHESENLEIVIDTIDKRAPSLSIRLVEATTTSLKVKANGSDASGIAGYQFSLNSSGVWSDEQTTDEYTFENLEPGTEYKVLVIAKDNAGNQTISEPKFLSTLEDGLGTIEATYDSESWANNKDVTITYTLQGNNTKAYYRQSENDEWIEMTESPTVVNYTQNGNLYVKLSDGTTDDEKNYTIEKIDSINPLITSFSYSNLAETSVVLNVAANDNESDIKSYAYDCGNGSWVESQNASYTCTGLTEQTQYEMKVTVYDNAGNETTESQNITTLSHQLSIYEIVGENAIADNISSTYVTNQNGIDFGQPSSDTNGKGIYILSSTASDTNPVYYYRGDVTNNNVIFGGNCWKIVRTTSEGAVKLIYNGHSSNGKCSETGQTTTIGTSKYNAESNSLAYIGYMYDDTYKYTNTNMSNSTDSYVYGNSVSYENGTYTLNDTVTGTWAEVKADVDADHHYTCLSDQDTCASVYYIVYDQGNSISYVELKEGATINDVLNTSLKGKTKSSTVKTIVDNWYSSNLSTVSNYIVDTNWVSDVTIVERLNWDDNEAINDGGNLLYFAGDDRAVTTLQPSIANPENTYTVANGSLTNPIGLLTSDELMLAGSAFGYTGDIHTYIRDEKQWWTMTPGGTFDFSNLIINIDTNGTLVESASNQQLEVRPSIAVDGTIVPTSGDGSYNSPYVLK